MTLRRSGPSRQWGWSIASVVVSAAVAVPIIAILLSLGATGDSEWPHIRDVLLPEYLENTAWLMAQVGLYCLVLGVGTAWLTVATSFPGRRVFVWTLSLPLAIPAYILAYVYTDLLDFSGPVQTAARQLLGDDAQFPEIRSLGGAAIVMSLSLYPYVYLLARVAFLQRSVRLFNAARTLGSSAFRAFFRIALPSARAAIAGGTALVLMETLADFGVVEYFGVPTFSTGIFRTWFAVGDRVAAMKLGAVMLILVIVLVAAEKRSRGRGAPSEVEVEGSFPRIQLRGWRAVAACVACLVPTTLGCLIPLGALVHLAASAGDPLLGSEFIAFATNSIRVSILAAAVAVVLALLLTYAQQRGAHWSTKGSIELATLGYALPGTMLAVGLLSPLTLFDRGLAEFFDTQLGWRSGLLLTGTTFVLIYALVTRFLTVAFNTTSGGMTQIPRRYEEAARTLGASRSRVIGKIQLPLLRRAIVTAALLVFVDSMRELPATLVLRPFNFETLATRVYRLAADERLGEASTAALAIVLIGLVPVLLLNRERSLDETTPP
ncbi:MAG: iron ABC transporter permease [Myxococcota bacterium]